MKAQTIEFKYVSPFFEQCRSGEKPVELRKVEPGDQRFETIMQWYKARIARIREGNVFTDLNLVKLVHTSGEVCYLEFKEIQVLPVDPPWALIYLGRVVPKEEAEA